MLKYILLLSCEDEVAEWLRRWTANPLGSPRVGSNPILVELFFIFTQIEFSLNGKLNKCRLLTTAKIPVYDIVISSF